MAVIVSRAADGELLGERITLPGRYVVNHVALGYASTVHAAEGLTVDTSHTVVTPGTNLCALYTAVTRGATDNTIYGATQTIPADAAPGTVNETSRRDPLAMLAAGIERDQPDLAAIVQAEHSQSEATSLRTIGERFADACELATAGRTATLLDRLVDQGTLTPTQRAALAADEGTVSLARVLRQAELAGHQPDRVLRDAITSRDLAGARSLASVLHQRIAFFDYADRQRLHRLDPDRRRPRLAATPRPPRRPRRPAARTTRPAGRPTAATMGDQRARRRARRGRRPPDLDRTRWRPRRAPRADRTRRR